MKKFSLAFAVTLVLVATHATAAVTVTIQEVGTSLVVSSTGTINTAVCTSIGGITNPAVNNIEPNTPELSFGLITSQQNRCNGTTVTPATVFGTGGALNGPVNTGVSYFFQPTIGFYGPNGWNSGTALTATMTFAGKSIASAGVTPGTYVYTLANGGSTDTITINVIASATTVPTLSEWGLIILATLMALLGGRQVWRRTTPF